MPAIRVSRCDSPLKAEGSQSRRLSGSIISQKKTTTIVRRPSKRPDLDMDMQIAAVKAEKLQAKQRWVAHLQPAATLEYQIASIKFAVAESMQYHHRNQSNVLAAMLDNEADKKGTSSKKGKKPSTCCGLPTHYVSVLMDDIELITKLDGASAALTSIRALPLWKVAQQQKM